ncbi:MAG: hypothetical protein IPO92_08830 [Saprospiraceae bacterium]|nr:hypothetical protein [Saprospiraceae bacterium]
MGLHSQQTNIPETIRIYHHKQKGGTEGANGLMLDASGNLILCQHGNRAVAKMLAPLSDPKILFISGRPI